MAEDLSFGYWVRRQRKALDLTQAELGRRAGASTAMIRKIEADERRPSRELAEILADQLAVPAQEREVFLRAARRLEILQKPPAISGSPTSPTRAQPIRAKLPAPMTSLINRVTALADVKSLLQRADVRLVTIIGPPGIGKTRLAIHTAWQTYTHFPDGAWFVDLSTVSKSAQIMPAIALALELPPAPGLTPAQRVATACREMELLLVLDNLEQILEDAALQLAALLSACPRVKVLATSRMRLDIYGEHEYAPSPMSFPLSTAHYTPSELLSYESVQLFVDRVRHHQPNFHLNQETAEPTANICRLMEGLPLALELAASGTRIMPISELAAALHAASGSDWHYLLRTTARNLPARQQTLFNAVAWSYSLLGVREQMALRRLSVIAGSFDAAASAAVVLEDHSNEEANMTALLSLLVDHGLLSQVARRPDRWRLLVMIREFGLAQLDGAEEEMARYRHAHYFAALQQSRYEDWSRSAYLEEIEKDLENYRAALRFALERGIAPLAYGLAAFLGKYFERVGLLFECRTMLQNVLELPGEIDPQMRFAVMLELMIVNWMQQDFAAAEILAEQVMSLTQQHQLLAAKVELLNLLGRIYLEEARYQEADRILVEAVALSRELSPPRAAGMEIIQRGEAALALGSLDLAQGLTVEGLSAVSDENIIPYCMGWSNLAEIALARQDMEMAAKALGRVVTKVHLHTRRTRIFLVAVAGLLLCKYPYGGQETAVAAKLLTFVSTTNARLADPLSPMTQVQLAERTARAKSLLTAQAWQKAVDEAEHWTQEMALAAARQVLN